MHCNCIATGAIESHFHTFIRNVGTDRNDQNVCKNQMRTKKTEQMQWPLNARRSERCTFTITKYKNDKNKTAR